MASSRLVTYLKRIILGVRFIFLNVTVLVLIVAEFWKGVPHPHPAPKNEKRPIYKLARVKRIIDCNADLNSVCVVHFLRWRKEGVVLLQVASYSRLSSGRVSQLCSCVSEPCTRMSNKRKRRQRDLICLLLFCSTDSQL